MKKGKYKRIIRAGKTLEEVEKREQEAVKENAKRVLIEQVIAFVKNKKSKKPTNN